MYPLLLLFITAMQSLTHIIYNVLTARSFARETRPYDETLAHALHYFIIRDEPISLVGFWGVGTKNAATVADLLVCDFFSRLIDLQTVYKQGIKFTFILATTHGEFNGYSRNAIINYASCMEDVFIHHRFNYIYLDSLWEKYTMMPHLPTLYFYAGKRGVSTPPWFVE